MNDVTSKAYLQLPPVTAGYTVTDVTLQKLWINKYLKGTSNIYRYDISMELTDL